MKCMKFTMLILYILVTLTGCWNNKDITELALVAGAAIDKSDDGEIELTAQIVKPSAIKPVGESVGTLEKGYVNLTAEGETIFEAVRNLLTISNRKLYWGYLQLLVISDSVASEGISDSLDFFERDHEPRQKAYVLITKNMKSKTVLESESQLEKIPVIHRVSTLESTDLLSKSLKVTLLDLFSKMDQESLGIVIPVLYMENDTKELSKEKLRIEGSAVIKRDKLAGYMNPYQTRGYLYTQNKVKSTILTIQSPLNKDKKIAVEIIQSKGRVKVRMENGLPVLSIDVAAEGNIAEQQEPAKLSETNLIDEMENELENKIRQEIQDAVDITQKQLGTDVFGFIGELNKNYYPQWERLVSNWDETYRKLPIDIQVDFKIRRSGLIDESAEFK